MEKFFEKKTLIFLFFLIVAFLIYSPMINGPFLFDDIHAIARNSYIPHFSNFFKFFTLTIFAGSPVDVGLDFSFYRPLQMIFHSFAYQISGLNPWFYHVMQVFIHCINALLLYAFIKKFKISSSAAFLGALLFLVHPVNVEAVSFISGLSDPLLMFFFLCGFNIYIDLNSEHKILKSLAVIFLMLLGLFTKEYGVMFAPFLTLITLYFKNPEVKKVRLAILISVWILTFVYIILKFHYMPNNEGLYVGTMYKNHLWVRLLTFISNLKEYFVLFFFPLHLYHSRPGDVYTDFSHFKTVFGTLFFVLTFAAGIWGIFKNKLIAFCVFWFYGAFVPYSGVYPINYTYLEHWMYFPIIAPLILISYFYDKIKYKKVFLSVFFIIILLFCTRVIIRNYDWGNEERFYRMLLKENPNSINGLRNLGAYYIRYGYPKQAFPYIIRAIQVGDNDPTVLNDLASAYLGIFDYKKAEELYLEALKLNPKITISLYALEEIYKKTNMPNRRQYVQTLIRRTNAGIFSTKEEINEISRIEG